MLSQSDGIRLPLPADPASDTNRLASTRNRRTCSNTRTTRWIGTRGARKLSRRPAARTSPSSCPSAIRPATGATSWRTSPSRTRQTAAVMNELFVNIKLDREERPDVDRVYMTFVQATSGSGGWPMSVWLQPDLKPIAGGTYFPPDDRYGRRGFVSVCRTVDHAWKNDRDKVSRRASASSPASARPRSARSLDLGRFRRGRSRAHRADVLRTAVANAGSGFRSRVGRVRQRAEVPAPGHAGTAGGSRRRPGSARRGGGKPAP